MMDKTALITGCNRGIGKATLEIFAGKGISVIACTRTGNKDLYSYYESLEKQYNIKIYPIHFDLSDDDSIRSGMKEIYALKIPIDILINNAGLAAGGFLSMTSIGAIKNIFQINYFAQVLITQYISKLMSRAKRGCIVNVVSVMGIDGMAGGSAYGASKSALILFTKSMAKELASFNIRVNAVAPNLINTDMAALMEEKSYNTMINAAALKRLGTPEEVAKVILFLASDQASYVNGQVIRIDGGM